MWKRVLMNLYEQGLGRGSKLARRPAPEMKGSARGGRAVLLARDVPPNRRNEVEARRQTIA